METNQNTETKKQEAIRLAWVKMYGQEKFNLIKYAISENGYIDCRKNPEISDIIDSTQKGIYWGTTAYCPKELVGISNNNGWIYVQSEEDLPKETCDVFWMDKTSGVLAGKFYFINDEENIKFLLANATHWQPIEKPNPPIF